jgi:hypothetical protein
MCSKVTVDCLKHVEESDEAPGHGEEEKQDWHQPLYRHHLQQNSCKSAFQQINKKL